ncbi:MAG: hypothetical protein ABSG51_08740 [Terracidiphilus sp.]
MATTEDAQKRTVDITLSSFGLPETCTEEAGDKPQNPRSKQYLSFCWMGIHHEVYKPSEY